MCLEKYFSPNRVECEGVYAPNTGKGLVGISLSNPALLETIFDANKL